MSQLGMSSSRVSSGWPRSPSAWPCWSATDAPASGGPTEERNDHAVPRGLTRTQELLEAATALGAEEDWSNHHQHDGQADGWPVPGLGVKIGARSGPRSGWVRARISSPARKMVAPPTGT